MPCLKYILESEKCPNENAPHTGRQFQSRTLLVRVCTQALTKKGRPPIEEQPLGMYDIYLDCLAFKSCMMKKKKTERKREKIEEGKKEDEQN